MKRSILILPVLLMALFAAGCGDAPLTLQDAEKYGDNCKVVGDHEYECSYTNPRGQICIVNVQSQWDNNTDSSCKPARQKMDCNSDSDNTSGNVCIVTLKDGTECVAVLPDGESNRKQDNIECPTHKAKKP